jgi:hypothetical protein
MLDRRAILARSVEAALAAAPIARRRVLLNNRALQVLIADLIAARVAAGMTQDEVAARMFTTRSVVSRLESGVRTRPTLRTIERYVVAVGGHCSSACARCASSRSSAR